MSLKKLLFVTGLLCFIYLVMEIFSFALYFFTDGKVFSFADLDKRREMVLASMQNGKKSDEVIGIVSNHTVPHPYLGFVYDPEVSTIPMITQYGFQAESDPIIASKDLDTAIIAVTGGSMAEQFFTAEHDSLHKFMEKLPQFKGKKIDIIMLGRGMFHQPQQLIAVAYYIMQGGRLDILINIDGFNEITGPLEQSTRGEYPAYPFAWHEMFFGLSNLNNLPKFSDMMMWKHIQYLAVNAFKPLDFSVTASTLWSLIDHYCQKNAVLDESEIRNTNNQNFPYFLTGPNTMHNASPKEIVGFGLRLWEQGSNQLNALAKTYHFNYFHFLQPNQYVNGSKTFSEAELKTAYNPKDQRYSNMGNIYPLLEDGIVKLHSQGENSYSLTGIYKHETRQVYTDICCHVNDLGNDIMESAISQQISAYFKAAQ